MAASSNTNPEIFFNFQPTRAMELKHLCASEFHPECLQMAEVTDGKAFDINALNTGTHAAENLFFKSSFMINSVYSSKSIISQLINADHIFQILVDATDNDGATNLSSIFGGTSSCDDSTIAVTSSSIRSPPVWNFVDAPGNNAVHPSAEIEEAATQEDGGNDNGNGGNNDRSNSNNDNNDAFDGNEDDDSNDRNGGNDRGTWIDGITALEPITIHRIDVQMNNRSAAFRPTIETNMYAFRYDSWEVLSEAMYRLWLQRNEDRNASTNGGAPVQRNPNNCWPGAFSIFGRYEGGCFYEIHWAQYSLNAVEVLVRDVLVVRPIYQ